MDFTAAIQAHTNWKLRLAAACTGMSPGGPDADTLAKDDQCELGRWLHSGGQRYASDPCFHDLLTAHARFHRTAGNVARMIALGKKTEAAAFIQSRDSDFGRGSLEVVGILMSFRARYGNNR